MIKGLKAIAVEDLKNSDKKGLSALYLYYLENGKPNYFDLPLFVDDNGKGVLSMECFKRVFYAFCKKCNNAFECSIVSGDDGNDASYNVVRVEQRLGVDTDFVSSVSFDSDFEEPLETDKKRESSKATREKSKAKKAEAEKAEKAETVDWNKKASMQIVDHLIGKYKMKVDRTTLETEIQNILNKIK